MQISPAVANQLHTIVFHPCEFQVVSMSSPCTDGDWKAIGLPMPGLAETGWPGFNRLGGDGGVVCGSAAIDCPMPAWDLLGLREPRFTKLTSIPSISGENSTEISTTSDAVGTLSLCTSHLDPLRRLR